MKKLNLKILLILAIFLMFNISPKAYVAQSYECYYKSSSGQKIKVTIGQGWDPNLLYPNPSSNSDAFKFYPANSVSPINNRTCGFLWFNCKDHYIFQQGSFEYAVGQACPVTMTNYYLKKEAENEYFIDGNNGYKIYSSDATRGKTYSTYFSTKNNADETFPSLIIEFSKKGRLLQKIEGLDTMEIDAVITPYDSDVTLLDKIKNNDKFTSTTFYYDEQIQEEEKPTIDDQGFMDCTYRNRKKENISFHLKKGNILSDDKETVTVGDNTKEVYRSIIAGTTVISTCPDNIIYPSNGNKEAYSILSCPSGESEFDSICYYRSDLPIEYDNNEKKRIRYLNTRTSAGEIDVYLLTAPNANGKMVIAKQNETELNFECDENNYLTGTDYPTYLIKVGEGSSAKITATYKLDSSDKSVAKKVYMLASKIGEFGDLKLGEIEKTCEVIYGDDFIHFLKNNVLNVIYIIVPIILLVLTTVDFVKVVMSNEKDGVKKAGSRFGKRVVAAILIYLTPTILIFLAEILGASTISDCAKYIQKIAKEEQTNQSDS